MTDVLYSSPIFLTGRVYFLYFIPVTLLTMANRKKKVKVEYACGDPKLDDSTPTSWVVCMIDDGDGPCLCVFPDTARLGQHRLRWHDKMIYRCRWCTKTFQSRSSHNDHEWKAHKAEKEVADRIKTVRGKRTKPTYVLDLLGSGYVPSEALTSVPTLKRRPRKRAAESETSDVEDGDGENDEDSDAGNNKATDDDKATATAVQNLSNLSGPAHQAVQHLGNATGQAEQTADIIIGEDKGAASPHADKPTLAETVTKETSFKRVRTASNTPDSTITHQRNNFESDDGSRALARIQHSGSMQPLMSQQPMEDSGSELMSAGSRFNSLCILAAKASSLQPVEALASLIQPPFDAEEMEKLRAEKKSLEMDLVNATDENKQLRTQMSASSSRIDQLTSDIAGMREKLVRLEAIFEELKLLKPYTEKLEMELAEAEAVNKGNLEQIQRLEAELAKAKEKLSEKSLEYNKLELELHNERESMKQSEWVSNPEEQMLDWRSKVESLEAVDRKLKESQNQLEEKKGEVDALKDTVGVLEQRIELLEANIQQLEWTMENQRMDIQTKLAKIHLLQEEVKEAKERISEKNLEHSQLEIEFQNSKLAFSSQSREIVDKCNRLQGMISLLNQKISDCEEDKRSGESLIANLKLELQQLDSEYTDYRKKAQDEALLNSGVVVDATNMSTLLDSLQPVLPAEMHKTLVSVLKIFCPSDAKSDFQKMRKDMHIVRASTPSHQYPSDIVPEPTHNEISLGGVDRAPLMSDAQRIVFYRLLYNYNDPLPKFPLTNKFRPCYVDGENVAMEYKAQVFKEHRTEDDDFGFRGIAKAVVFFKKRLGYPPSAFKVFIRAHNIYKEGTKGIVRDNHHLKMLMAAGVIQICPSRVENFKELRFTQTDYDDVILLLEARAKGGFVLSNDLFRDVFELDGYWKLEKLRFVAEKRRIGFRFTSDGSFDPFSATKESPDFLPKITWCSRSTE